MKIASILLLICLLMQSSCTGQQAPTSIEHADQLDAETVKVLTPDDITVGAQRFSEFMPALKDKRVGVVVNQTSFVSTSTHLVDTLLRSGIEVTVIFSPEHGFRGDADAGASIADGKDISTGLPIISLYGKSKKPSSDELANVDVVIFDIQDVGARFYTYLSTMHYVMEACAEFDKKLIILDRPNPNGFYVDGPVLETKFKSFVGMHPIPIVHGMTFGELAKMIVGERMIEEGLDYKIVSCMGYDHQSTFDLPIKPSPNLPYLRSILLYPSICLFEPTDFSVGRGTNMQFQVVGRPELQTSSFMFTPTSMPGARSPKHIDEDCYGVNLQEYQLDKIFATRKLDLSFLIKYLSSDQTDLITSTSFFDKLAGTDRLRLDLASGKSEQEIRDAWQPELDVFKKKRLKYLIYD